MDSDTIYVKATGKIQDTSETLRRIYGQAKSFENRSGSFDSFCNQIGRGRLSVKFDPPLKTRFGDVSLANISPHEIREKSLEPGQSVSCTVYNGKNIPPEAKGLHVVG